MKNKLFSTALFKSVVDREQRVVHVVASTGVVDRHGESVNPNGWKLENFQANPVVLVAHDFYSLPVGKVIKSWVEDNALHQHIQLADTEEGRKVFYLVDGGFLNTVSVSFIVLKWGQASKDPYTIMEQELLETSWVAVPANPQATIQNDIKENFQTLCKSIETKGFQKTVTMTEAELRSLFAEEFEKAIQGKKVVEEKIVEKIKYVNGNQLSDSAITLLLQINKTLEKSSKKSDSAANLLHGLLNVKTSIQGGDK